MSHNQIISFFIKKKTRMCTLHVCFIISLFLKIPTVQYQKLVISTTNCVRHHGNVHKFEQENCHTLKM